MPAPKKSKKCAPKGNQDRLRAGPTHLECALRSFGDRAVADGRITSEAFRAASELVETAALLNVHALLIAPRSSAPS